MICHLVHLPVVDSTNTYLRSLVDAQEWTCVTADQQTAGRGRQQRQWHSEPGVGLYLSVLLRPTGRIGSLPLISLAAAIAVAETLTDYGVGGVDIKWPNDILVRERKISGILVETTGLGNGDTPRVIVGIGVNLNHRSFPPHLNDRATSLLAETGMETSPPSFRDQLLDRLSHWYGDWRLGATEKIRNRWLALSTYGVGRAVTVNLDQELLAGVTAGLARNGELLLRTADGSLRAIAAGEVCGLRPLTTNLASGK
ncbi:MAG: biotin--[acetyl-CoA-carboxylase] ligase [Acidobacteria bacterium]|nr:biotin--[acetyl-CoA-carboxylase] ligase [Acidobacteriota bacterium]